MDAQVDLRNARLFMEEARLVQLESGASMRGRPGLKEAQRLAIRGTSPCCTIAEAPLEASPDVKAGLLERFEEMCRRQRIEVPKELRPAILERLLLELWVNQRALNEKADKLVSVTAYSGAIGPELSREFAAFRDTPFIFKVAAVSNPGDPKGFLRGVQKNIEALAADAEFAAFRDTPGIFKWAAVHNPGDPRAWLRSDPKSDWHALRVKNRRAVPQGSQEPEM